MSYNTVKYKVTQQEKEETPQMPLLDLEAFCRTGDFELDFEKRLWTVWEQRMCAEARRGELMGRSRGWHGTSPLPYTIESHLIRVSSC